MVTLWMIVVLIGVSMQLASFAVVAAFIGLGLYVIFIQYFVESISLTSLHRWTNKKGAIINFVPIIRGYNEGKLIGFLCKREMAIKDETKKIAGEVLIAKLIYFVFIIMIALRWYICFESCSHSTGILIELANTTYKVFAMDGVTLAGYIIMLVAFIAAFFRLVALRCRAMKAVGMWGIVAFLVALFLAPIWALITKLYLKTIGSKNIEKDRGLYGTQTNAI